MDAVKVFKVSFALLIVGVLALLAMVGVLTFTLFKRSSTPPPSATAGAPTAPAAPTTGAALDRIRTRGTLLVGTDTGTPPGEGSPPMYVVGEDGTIDGFDVAVARRIAQAVGVTDVRFVHTRYPDLAGTLVNQPDQYDLFLAGYVPDSSPGVAWSEPYLDFGLCLIVPSGSGVSTTADLFGKPIGIFPDEAAAEAVQKMVKGFTELKQIEDGYWDMLMNGEIAAFIYDYPFAVEEIRQYYGEKPENKGKLKIAQYNLNDSTYNVGVRATEPELLAAVNKAILSMRESPDYKDIMRKFLAPPALSTEDLAAQARSAATAGGKTYTVVAGDTFSVIAQRQLGDVDRWRDIWTLNKGIVPNPNLLEVGQTLKMP